MVVQETNERAQPRVRKKEVSANFEERGRTAPKHPPSLPYYHDDEVSFGDTFFGNRVVLLLFIHQFPLASHLVPCVQPSNKK